MFTINTDNYYSSKLTGAFIYVALFYFFDTRRPCTIIVYFNSVVFRISYKLVIKCCNLGSFLLMNRFRYDSFSL